MEATEVTKVKCLGGHVCDRNQPFTEETRATEVVIMGATGVVSMVRRFIEVDQLILLSPNVGGDRIFKMGERVEESKWSSPVSEDMTHSGCAVMSWDITA
ncbi:hypothetical protein PoB_001648700 [Plakobranchus ocellatus]|uniref:Uncharacterized protein n=1 Tax=Plakobranchus ocellatus TaxID=259542 RepID=A0AAV3Z636_9GAST|nr:hypothetical protein PoB_001648700 [Plakobranchus ocellatus]